MRFARPRPKEESLKIIEVDVKIRLMEKLPEKKIELTPEEIELSIEALLAALDEKFGESYNDLSPELQDRWYDAEMEAKVGKDRVAAKNHLEQFIDILRKNSPKPEVEK